SVRFSSLKFRFSLRSPSPLGPPLIESVAVPHMIARYSLSRRFLVFLSLLRAFFSPLFKLFMSFVCRNSRNSRSFSWFPDNRRRHSLTTQQTTVCTANEIILRHFSN